jgi:hypothetical protein
MAPATPDLLSAPEVLTIKLSIARKRLEYAQEIRDYKQIAINLALVSDLTERLATHGATA